MAKTVFILGAGASFPYDFPLGTGLIRLVANELELPKDNKSLDNSNDRLGLKRMLVPNFGIDLIKEFRTNLLDSDFDSIDSFLFHNPKYLDLGKACISLILLEKERMTQHIKRNGGDWYRYFWNMLSPEDPETFDFKIYTFNYERSLRYYLYRKVNAAFVDDEKKQEHFLRAVPIYHLHGSLGNIGYGAMKDIHRYEDLKKVADFVKIISEVKDDNTFISLQKDIKYAQHIFFLGFGFHPDNIKRLGLEKRLELKSIKKLPIFYASVYGKKDAEIKSYYQKPINQLYSSSSIITRDARENTKYADMDNLEFLRNYLERDFLFK